MAFLAKFKQGLAKTRDFITSGFNKISAAMGYFDEDMLDELEELLVQADLGVNCATELMTKVRQDIQINKDNSRSAVLNSLNQGILAVLGESQTLSIEAGKLNVILLIGVNGTGKTTSAGKMADRYKKQGKKVMLAAADTFRAAAIDQLKYWAEITDVPCIAYQEGADPGAVVFDAVKAAKARNVDVLIIDTAGRLHNKKNLMEELAKLRRIIEREAGEAKVERLLVVDANTGQNAVIQAKLFNEVADLTGIIITKLDGNSKGGVAVAVANTVKLPIYLAGLGEQVQDLADFDAQAFVASLLPTE